MGKKGLSRCFRDCKRACYQILCMHSEGTFSRQYEIQPGELGRGRYTVVKKAVKQADGTEVAVKEIYKGSCDEEEIDAAYEEVKIMRRARHPNCIALYEVIETPIDLYIIMELATGGQLFDRIIAKHHFSEKIAASCFAQVMDALGYLHARGIAHRDMKAENVLLADESEDAVIKLCDFGLGKVMHRRPHRGFRRQRMNSFVGTPAYAAPEMFEQKGYGREIDVWSSGVILYVMLSGVFPWKMDDGVEAIIEQSRQAKYEFPQETWGKISKEAKSLVSAMLELNAKKRISCKDCLKHPWIHLAKMGQLSDAHMPQAQHRLRSASIISAEQMLTAEIHRAVSTRGGSRRSSEASTRTPLDAVRREAKSPRHPTEQDPNSKSPRSSVRRQSGQAPTPMEVKSSQAPSVTPSPMQGVQVVAVGNSQHDEATERC